MRGCTPRERSRESQQPGPAAAAAQLSSDPDRQEPRRHGPTPAGLVRVVLQRGQRHPVLQRNVRVDPGASASATMLAQRSNACLATARILADRPLRSSRPLSNGYLPAWPHDTERAAACPGQAAPAGGGLRAPAGSRGPRAPGKPWHPGAASSAKIRLRGSTRPKVSCLNPQQEPEGMGSVSAGAARHQGAPTVTEQMNGWIDG